MAAEAELTPTSYIQHHLQNLTHSFGEGGFWTLHVDTFVTAVAMGLLMVFAFWVYGIAAALQRVRANILEREKHTDWVQQLQEAR